MQDERSKREGQTGQLPANGRQDRLKLALRENLKRRKSQARARGDVTTAPSAHADSSLNEGGGKKPAG